MFHDLGESGRRHIEEGAEKKKRNFAELRLSRDPIFDYVGSQTDLCVCVGVHLYAYLWHRFREACGSNFEDFAVIPGLLLKSCCTFVCTCCEIQKNASIPSAMLGLGGVGRPFGSLLFELTSCFNSSSFFYVTVFILSCLKFPLNCISIVWFVHF